MRYAQSSKRKDRGAGLTEYAILVALVALVSMIGVQNFGVVLRSEFLDIGEEVESATGGGAIQCGDFPLPPC